MVNDAVEIATAAGYEGKRFHLVGHDWGGQVSWGVANAHPERLASLTVLSRPHPLSFRRGSNIHFIRGGESAVTRGLGFVAMTALLGWWGIPWGPIFSVQSLWTNLSGGKDVTEEVLNHLYASAQQTEPAPSIFA